MPGDTEVYCVYRSNFDMGKITKSDLSFGPVREVDLTAGFDFDSTNNVFASNKKFGHGSGPSSGSRSPTASGTWA